MNINLVSHLDFLRVNFMTVEIENNFNVNKLYNIDCAYRYTGYYYISFITDSITQVLINDEAIFLRRTALVSP